MKSLNQTLKLILRRLDSRIGFPMLMTSIFLLTLLSSCLPEPIDIEVEPAEPEIVVSSQIIPDEILVVSLTQSFSALAINLEEDSLTEDFFNDLLIDSALVTVTYAGQTDTLFNLTNGFYGSLSTLQIPLQTYTLYARDYRTGKEITAATQMLPQIQFSSLRPVVDKSGDSAVSLEFAFNDPSGDNWYALSVVQSTGESDNGNLDPNTFLQTGTNLVTTTELIVDKAYNTTTISGTLELPDIGPTDTIAVYLSNITEDYFTFLDARSRSQGIFTQVTAEPVNHPTNVIGGLGFFNAYYPDIRVFDLSQF